MTRKPHRWYLGLLAIASMLLISIAPAIPVSAQADAATQFAAVINQLPTMTPAAGPLGGSFDAANAQSVSAGVSVANGVAHTEFTVPNTNAGTLWAMAVLFRVSDAGQNFLLIFPDGTWQLDNGQGAAVTGTGATFASTPGTTVIVDVLFDGPTGAFGLNGQFVSQLDLTAVQGTGDVQLTGYLGLGAGVDDIGYANFSVYDLSGGVSNQPVAPTAVTDLPTAIVPPAEPTIAGGVTGDPVSIFNQYIVLETTQPKAFGPASGVLIHDAQRVTFEPTNVTVTDFGTHITCVAPRPAAQLWDCGLAFRDTFSTNHFRLGVVSDGQWFLSIGNGDPLQSGTGLAIGPNAGDTVTLDLIVLDDTGYFGVNGQFVSELDLSEIPGPGSVEAVIGFFNETFVAGGQTAYQDFYVVDFDTGTAPTEPTAVIDIPTIPPTVVIPPVESPTPISGTLTGTTYTSPTFGYQLTWDPSWSVVEDSTANGFDVLSITNGIVTTDLYSGASTMGLEECITSLVEYYQTNASYANVALETFANGQSILIDGNVAIATLTFDYTDATNTTSTITDQVICVALPAQNALVTLESYIPTDQLEMQQDTVRELQQQFVIDGMPVQLPAIPADGNVPVTTPSIDVTPEIGTTTEAGSDTTSFMLTGTNDSSVSGFGTLTAQGRSVQLMALISNAEAGSGVGIIRGSCVEVASEVEPDYYIGETDASGIAQGTAPVSLTVLMTRGPYSVVVYGPTDGSPMAACGQISGS